MSASEVQLVSGHLSGDELAAIAVAVSAYSVISREEAHERELLERTDAPRSEWTSPVHRFPSASHLRTQPSATAWMFSHR